MEKRRVVMSVQFEIEDPVAVVSSGLRMMVDGSSGQEIVYSFPPDQVEHAVGDLLARAVSDALDRTPGVTFAGASVVGYQPEPDGSFPRVEVPGIPGPRASG